jgi:cytochrome c-type biogenesis protein CcmF
MAVAPLLPWRTAGRGVLRSRLLGPAWVAAATMVIAVIAGARGIPEVVVFGLAAFCLAGIARQVGVAARARRRADTVGPLRALARTVRANPRLYGGLIVHTGVVVVAVAFAASRAYASETDMRLAVGESHRAGGHTFTYLGAEERSDDRRSEIVARVAIDGDDVYAPSLRTYPTMIVATPSVRTGVTEDVYLKLTSITDEAASITVFVNPLVVWLWIGGGIIAVGTAVALVPVRRGTRRPGAGPGPGDPDGGDAADPADRDDRDDRGEPARTADESDSELAEVGA